MNVIYLKAGCGVMFMSILERFSDTAFVADIAMAFVFALVLGIFLYRNRAQVKFERMLFPIIYSFLFRGKFGIKWMEKFVNKHKEGVKLFGYISIGVGFLGMFAALVLIVYVAVQMVFKPKAASVAPFLPFVDVPVLGYISFSHWIITIFVIVIVHEAAHGLVAIAHGLKVKNTGFGVFAIFLPLVPAAFVEPDDKKIAKKSDVTQYSIFAAGPMANFVLMIPLLLIVLLVINPIEGVMTEQDGFTFDVIQNESLPAYMAGIKDGMVFNQFNSKDVATIEDFYREIFWLKPGVTFTMGYYNESSGLLAYEYSITSVPNPDDEKKGFIGITGMRNNVMVLEEAQPYAGIFSWFKGLIILMFDITFSLGLINLFPASITDGGRMFSLALDMVSKNKKLNKRIVSALAVFFLFVIFFALVTFFTGNPFALIFG